VLDKLKNEAKKTFTFYASNSLVANPGKTVLMIIHPKGKNADTKREIVLEDQIVVESPCERILGVSMKNDLTWTSHILKVKQKVNNGLFTLRRLKSCLSQKSLKIIADGLIMSHLRYCSSTYLSDKIRIQEADPTTNEIKNLQILQNKMLRIISGVHLMDKVSIKSLLDRNNMFSINQMACFAILMDTWKSLNLGTLGPEPSFKTRSSARYKNYLQGNADPKSFISMASKLYNLCSARFKTTNLGQFSASSTSK
jgi:hypothetical protein